MYVFGIMVRRQKRDARNKPKKTNKKKLRNSRLDLTLSLIFVMMVEHQNRCEEKIVL